MEEIDEEQQLKIVREKTNDPILITAAIAVVAAFWALTLMTTPNGKAVFGAVALAGGFTVVMLAMVRRNFFLSAFGAAALTMAAFAYFTWLLPLLAK